MADAPDVAVVGAGIVGCATAVFLAEAGASVLLVERDDVGAAASGRNSGILQHPMDPALVPLYEESLGHYRALAEHGLAVPAEPSGLLVIAPDEDALAGEFGALRAFPELRAELLAAGAPAALEPALAPDLAAIRLHTGHPVGPVAATRAFAARAVAAGARLVTGAAAALAPGGLSVAGAFRPAGAVVVAAGPWTPALVDPAGRWRPIEPLWGVVAAVRLAAPPRHALEQGGIPDQTGLEGAEPVARAGGEPPLFSLITSAAESALGSTFLARQPDAAAIAPLLRAHGARFVPALASVVIESVRCCARPLSADGRPLLGRAPERDGVYVAAGHGPWGISLGPASGRLVADLVLGRGEAPPAALDPARFA